MSQRPNIKTLKDGSIDYAHYIAVSHDIRRNDLHLAFAAARKHTKIAIKVIKSRLTKYTATGLSKVPDQHALPTSVFKSYQ